MNSIPPTSGVSAAGASGRTRVRPAATLAVTLLLTTAAATAGDPVYIWPEFDKGDRFSLERVKTPEALRHLGRLARGQNPVAPAATRAIVGAAEADVEEARKTLDRLAKGFDPYLAAVAADGLCVLDAKGLLVPQDAPAL